MTDEVIIGFLKQIKEILLHDKSWLESTKNPIAESFDTAIKAIEDRTRLKEVIGKIKDEINKSIIISRLADCKGLADGLETALEFVNKYTEGLI